MIKAFPKKVPWFAWDIVKLPEAIHGRK